MGMRNRLVLEMPTISVLRFIPLSSCFG